MTDKERNLEIHNAYAAGVDAAIEKRPCDPGERVGMLADAYKLGYSDTLAPA